MCLIMTRVSRKTHEKRNIFVTNHSQFQQKEANVGDVFESTPFRFFFERLWWRTTEHLSCLCSSLMYASYTLLLLVFPSLPCIVFSLIRVINWVSLWKEAKPTPVFVTGGSYLACNTCMPDVLMHDLFFIHSLIYRIILWWVDKKTPLLSELVWT